jgi:hypothetical protein
LRKSCLTVCNSLFAKQPISNAYDASLAERKEAWNMRCLMAVIVGGGFGSCLRQCLYAPDTVECFWLLNYHLELCIGYIFKCPFLPLAMYWQIFNLIIMCLLFIAELPGVLQVVPSKTLQLHTGPGIGRLH